MKVSGRGRCRSWHSNHGRRRDAYPLRVKAVKTRVQTNVRLEAERMRGQTDSQVGMPEDSSCQLYIYSTDAARSEGRLRAIL
jgi:hypothetical protein